MRGGYEKVVKGSPPKTVSLTRRVLLIIDTYSQVLNVWKQVGPTILGSKIFLRLVALEDWYAVCKGYGITTSFEPACRGHDFFICN